MDNNFAEWLVFEINKREWSQSDLARSSGLSRQAISDYVNRKRNNPDENALKAIAHAFKLPPETIFRAAGVLPPKLNLSITVEKANHLLSQLPEGEQEEILALIEFRYNRWEKSREQKNTRTPLGNTT